VLVMERDQEIAGDYGYDLAHEEIGRAKATENATGQPGGGASPVGGQDDGSEDFGYDQAHDF
jgi:hypothetical protein